MTCKRKTATLWMRSGLCRAAAAQQSLDLEVELRCDDDPFSEGFERFADQVLVRERALRFRRVEQRHAALDRGRDQTDHCARSVA
jgi:hypothetical protein